MSKSAKKLANYAEIAERDRQARAIAEETGCGFVEAWLRVLDGEDIARLGSNVDAALVSEGIP